MTDINWIPHHLLADPEAMNNLSGAARRVTRNLDQFSVICVFGSVVGCVVLPLMVQVGVDS